MTDNGPSKGSPRFMGNWRIKDLSGKTFGKLKVIAFAGIDPKSKKALWLCRCECGTEKTIRGTSLTSGKTTSCGCELKRLLSRNRADLSGKRYGQLTVIKYAGVDPKYRSPMYLCRCDCGTEKKVRASNLVGGGTTSCGCTRKPAASK